MNVLSLCGQEVGLTKNPSVNYRHFDYLQGHLKEGYGCLMSENTLLVPSL